MTESAEHKRARGRPHRSPSQRAEMRREIEQAASRLFQSDGYGAVSMRRIAKQVGCSPMALYAYFENKVDLLQSLWAQVFNDLFEQVQPAISKADTSRAKLQALSFGYVRYWLENPERYRMVFMAEGISQSEVSIFVDDPAIAKHFSIFPQLVSKMLAPSHAAQDLKQKSDLLVSALHGIAHTQITMSGYDWTQHQRLIEMILDTLDQTRDAGGEKS